MLAQDTASDWARATGQKINDYRRRQEVSAYAKPKGQAPAWGVTASQTFHQTRLTLCIQIIFSTQLAEHVLFVTNLDAIPLFDDRPGRSKTFKRRARRAGESPPMPAPCPRAISVERSLAPPGPPLRHYLWYFLSREMKVLFKTGPRFKSHVTRSTTDSSRSIKKKPRRAKSLSTQHNATRTNKDKKSLSTGQEDAP